MAPARAPAPAAVELIPPDDWQTYLDIIEFLAYERQEEPLKVILDMVVQRERSIPRDSDTDARLYFCGVAVAIEKGSRDAKELKEVLELMEKKRGFWAKAMSVHDYRQLRMKLLTQICLALLKASMPTSKTITDKQMHKLDTTPYQAAIDEYFPMKKAYETPGDGKEKDDAVVQSSMAERKRLMDIREEKQGRPDKKKIFELLEDPHRELEVFKHDMRARIEQAENELLGAPRLKKGVDKGEALIRLEKGLQKPPAVGPRASWDRESLAKLKDKRWQAQVNGLGGGAGGGGGRVLVGASAASPKKGGSKDKRKRIAYEEEEEEEDEEAAGEGRKKNKQYKDPLNEALGTGGSDDDEEEEERSHKHRKQSHGGGSAKKAASSSASEGIQGPNKSAGKKGHKVTKSRVEGKQIPFADSQMSDGLMDDEDEIQDEDEEEGERRPPKLPEATKRQSINLPPARRATTKGKGSRKRIPWSREEEENLRDAVVNRNMFGDWATILKMGEYWFEPTRTGVDLKDKWRNLQKKK